MTVIVSLRNENKTKATFLKLKNEKFQYLSEGKGNVKKKVFGHISFLIFYLCLTKKYVCGFFFSKKSKRNLDIAFLWHYIPAVKYKNKRVKKLYNCSKCQQYIAYISNTVCIFFFSLETYRFHSRINLSHIDPTFKSTHKGEGDKKREKVFLQSHNALK